jgi:pimeloyl-ACP methyl ester carboxylesterase
MLELIDKGSATEAHPVPLLFVHGGYHAAWCWDENFLDYFAGKGFRAVAVSLRGHGQSTLSRPLRSCSIADYVDDVRAAADQIGSEPVLVGHSMGCFVVQNYLEKHPVQAAVLMAPATAPGLRRSVLRMFCSHPWVFVRGSISGRSADLVNTPELARESLFCAHTPEPIVRSCAARMQPESARAGIDQIMVIRLHDTRLKAAPMLVLGAIDDGMRTMAEVSATAQVYRTEAEFFPNMGHNMMLETGWRAVAERIDGWLAGQGL